MKKIYFNALAAFIFGAVMAIIYKNIDHINLIASGFAFLYFIAYMLIDIYKSLKGIE